MKKLLFICLVIFSANVKLSAQSLPNFDAIELRSKEDYILADPAALKAAEFILSCRMDKGDIQRLKSAQFLGRWMLGTPDHQFIIDESIAKYFEKDMRITTVYMASMAFYAIQNRPEDIKILTLNAVKIFLGYVNNKASHVKITPGLQQLNTLYNSGELQKSLAL